MDRINHGWMRRGNADLVGVLGILFLYLVIFALIFSVSGLIGGFLWPYCINTWLHWAEKPETVKFWHGFLIGMVPGVGGLSIPAALLTFIVNLFMD